jgi:hypothetical protein
MNHDVVFQGNRPSIIVLRKVLVCIILFIAGAFALPQVRAVTPQNIVNYASEWQIVEAPADIWVFYIDINFTQGTLAEMVFELPACTICIASESTYHSSILIQSEGGTVVSETLETGLIADFTAGIDITIDFEAGTVGNGGVYSIGEAEIMFADSVTLVMHMSADDPGSALLSWVKDRAPVMVTTWAIPVLFYNRLTLYDYTVYTPDLAAPANPSPPSGYRFVGWKSKTGSLFDFANPYISDDMLTTTAEDGTHLKLFASYIFIDEGTEATPDLTPETVPLFISGPMAMVGLDNDKGYFMIYMFIAILVVFGMLVFIAPHVDNIVPYVMIVELVWTCASIWLGILPLWGAAILIAIELGFTIKGFSTGGAAA